MSRSRRQPAPTSPQQATGARVPAMAAPVSGPGTSAIPQPSSHQLEALERPGPRQPPTPFPTSAKSMAQYNPSFGLANAAGPIVPHSAPTGYAGRQVSNSPIALHATPFAPWSGGLGEQCVNPAALQPDGVSGTSSRPIAIPWAPAIYEGRDPPAQRPINHHFHTVDGVLPSTKSPQISNRHSGSKFGSNDISLVPNDQYSPFRTTKLVMGEPRPWTEGESFDGSGWAGPSSSQQKRSNAARTIEPGSLPFGEPMEASSSSSSGEGLRRISESAFAGDGSLSRRSKGKAKRVSSWAGSSVSMSSDTVKHIPLPFDLAQREREFEALEEETSGKPTRQDRRRVQNRLAQRAFRARSKVQTAEASQHTVDLEYLSSSQGRQIEQMANVIAGLQAENAQLKRILGERNRGLGLSVNQPLAQPAAGPSAGPSQTFQRPPFSSPHFRSDQPIPPHFPAMPMQGWVPPPAPMASGQPNLSGQEFADFSSSASPVSNYK